MYECETLQDFYRKVGSELLLKGKTVCPRGQETKEILNANFMIKNPRARLVYQKDRKFSLVYAIVESLMLIQETDELKFFSEFNENIGNFSDDGRRLYGAYGMRTNISILKAIEKLRKDPDSRQCVIPILRGEDIATETKDVPCTSNLHFMIRDGKLNLHVNMRSSDIIWGIPYDVFMFTMLQEVVANELGVQIGTYYHNSNSLHVYKPFYETLANMTNDCISVECTNDAKYVDWMYVGLLYMAWVGKNIEGYFPFEKNTYSKILANHFNHKYCDIENAKYEVPEWVKIFIKRWSV